MIGWDNFREEYLHKQTFLLVHGCYLWYRKQLIQQSKVDQEDVSQFLNVAIKLMRKET